MLRASWLLLALRLSPRQVTAAAQGSEGPSDPIVLFPEGAPDEVPGWFSPEVTTWNAGDGEGCGPEHGRCYHINNVSVPTITPYLVENSTGAAIVLAPGGGYSVLSWSVEGLDVARMFNGLGVNVFLLKYRVPGRPWLPFGAAPLQDAQRAISTVRARAAQWGLNASRIGFAGFSAGGHLAAHVSTGWRNRSYPRVDAADDASCRPDFVLLGYPWKLLVDNDVHEPFRIDPALRIDDAHPPAFFVHAVDDPTAPVQGSLAYFTRMKEVNTTPPELHIYPAGRHGFALCQKLQGQFLAACEWPMAARRFLQSHGCAPGWPGGSGREATMGPAFV